MLRVKKREREREKGKYIAKCSDEKRGERENCLLSLLLIAGLNNNNE